MGTRPLFHSDTDEIKAKLRLSGARQDDALAIIDDAVEQTRLSIFTRLGANRVNEILTIEYVENPTTPNELLRAKASMLEFKMVYIQLFRRLPTLFMDTAGVGRQAWNEEGLTRNTGLREREAEISRLESEIDGLIDELAGSPNNDNNLNVSTIGPSITPPRPGDSTRAKYGGWCGC